MSQVFDMPAIPDVLRLHPRDNVCVAIRPLEAGRPIAVGDKTICLAGPIPMGHKDRAAPLDPNQAVIKYGQPIGVATQAIAAGRWVHTHNVGSASLPAITPRRHRDSAGSDSAHRPHVPGLRRADGKPGTRNYVAVISNCELLGVGEQVRGGALRRRAPRKLSRISTALCRSRTETGCGMQFGGEGHATLNRVMAGIARHPNIGATC